MKNYDKKKILLVSESDSFNLGDKLISELVFRICKDKGFDVEQFPISKGRRYFLIKVIYKFAALFNIMGLYNYAVQVMTSICIKQKIDNKTIIIFSGGQMFINYFIDPIIAITKQAKKKKAQVYFNACGSGIIADEYKNDLKLLLEGCNVSLRDSVENFREIYKDAYYRPDIAIATSEILSIKVSKNSTPTIGWGVINTKTYNFWNKGVYLTDENYIESAKTAIQELTRQGYNVEIFTTGDPTDYQLAKNLYNNIRHLQNVSICNMPITTKELILQVQKFDFVVASRMHALIISYSYGIPFVALKWEAKISDFARQVQCENRVYDMARIKDIDWQETIRDLQQQGLKESKRKELVSLAINGINEVLEQ